MRALTVQSALAVALFLSISSCFLNKDEEPSASEEVQPKEASITFEPIRTEQAAEADPVPESAEEMEMEMRSGPNPPADPLPPKPASAETKSDVRPASTNKSTSADLPETKTSTASKAASTRSDATKPAQIEAPSKAVAPSITEPKTTVEAPQKASTAVLADTGAELAASAETYTQARVESGNSRAKKGAEEAAGRSGGTSSGSKAKGVEVQEYHRAMYEQAIGFASQQEQSGSLEQRREFVRKSDSRQSLSLESLAREERTLTESAPVASYLQEDLQLSRSVLLQQPETASFMEMAQNPAEQELFKAAYQEAFDRLTAQTALEEMLQGATPQLMQGVQGTYLAQAEKELTADQPIAEALQNARDRTVELWLPVLDQISPELGPSWEKEFRPAADNLARKVASEIRNEAGDEEEAARLAVRENVSDFLGEFYLAEFERSLQAELENQIKGENHREVGLLIGFEDQLNAWESVSSKLEANTVALAESKEAFHRHRYSDPAFLEAAYTKARYKLQLDDAIYRGMALAVDEMEKEIAGEVAASIQEASSTDLPATSVIQAEIGKAGQRCVELLAAYDMRDFGQNWLSDLAASAGQIRTQLETVSNSFDPLEETDYAAIIKGVWEEANRPSSRQKLVAELTEYTHPLRAIHEFDQLLGGAPVLQDAAVEIGRVTGQLIESHRKFMDMAPDGMVAPAGQISAVAMNDAAVFDFIYQENANGAFFGATHLEALNAERIRFRQTLIDLATATIRQVKSEMNGGSTESENGNYPNEEDFIFALENESKIAVDRVPSREQIEDHLSALSRYLQELDADLKYARQALASNRAGLDELELAFAGEVIAQREREYQGWKKWLARTQGEYESLSPSESHILYYLEGANAISTASLGASGADYSKAEQLERELSSATRIHVQALQEAYSTLQEAYRERLDQELSASREELNDATAGEPEGK